MSSNSASIMVLTKYQSLPFLSMVSAPQRFFQYSVPFSSEDLIDIIPRHSYRVSLTFMILLNLPNMSSPYGNEATLTLHTIPFALDISEKKGKTPPH